MPGWTVLDFVERFDEWVERESPTHDERAFVMSWIHLLQTDPYHGAERRTELGLDHWFAVIPDTDDGRHSIVCLYVVDEDAQTLRCASITKLRHPIV